MQPSIRDGQFAAAVDTLAANVGEEVKQKILTGDSTLTKEAVIVIAKEEPEKQREKEQEIASADVYRMGQIRRCSNRLS